MCGLGHLFEQLFRERTYVYNVTPKTRDWVRTAPDIPETNVAP